MAIPPPDEIELLDQAKNRVGQGFEILVERYLSAVVNFFSYLDAPNDDIDDLVQETFTKAFRKLDLFDRERSFLTWLLSIARNVFYDQCRKNTREKNFLSRAPSGHLSSTEEIAIKRSNVRELLDSLPGDAKFLVEMRIFRNLTFAEIATITGDSPGNLRVRFHRIMTHLRDSSRKEEEK